MKITDEDVAQLGEGIPASAFGLALELAAAELARFGVWLQTKDDSGPPPMSASGYAAALALAELMARGGAMIPAPIMRSLREAAALSERYALLGASRG